MLKKPMRLEHKLDLSILVVFLSVYALFFIGNPGVFSRFDIYYSFMSTIPFIAILALSVTLVVVLGMMDLSFPSVLAFSAWVFGAVFTATGNMPLAVIACLAVGTACGFINSILVVHIGVPSLVATIGSMFFWRGAVNMVAQGRGISLVGAMDRTLFTVFVGRIGGVIPAQFIWMVLAGLFFGTLLKRHRFGTHLLFVGDNEQSAAMMGINVKLVKTIAFMQVGAAAAFVGILSTLEVTYFWPSQGQGYLMSALAAVFVGGTSVFGGMGTMLGTFLGALLIGSLEAGIISSGLSGFWIQFIYGLLIMISVSTYATMMRKRG
ncbi:MAG: ABC transporter permease [Spirochaetaceae bacterium]|nr:MAG: ABC transporter permease [Spirochaetaceae bacterium]